MSNFYVDSTASSSAIAFTVAPGRAWQLKQIMCHLDAGGAASAFTATLDAAAGANYDAVLYSTSMGSVTSLVRTFDPPIELKAGDEVDIAYANGSSAAFGVTVVYRGSD